VTPLVAVIVIVLVGVLAANVISRARSGVRSVRTHHRALDTLGHITTKRPVAAPREAVGVGALSAPDAPRQAHIRILPAIVDEEEEIEEPIPEPAVEIEEPVAVPPAPWFRLAPAPDNDLWDTVAIRELVDGPEVKPGEDGTEEDRTQEEGAEDGTEDSADDGTDADDEDGEAGADANDVTGPQSIAAPSPEEEAPEHEVFEPAWAAAVAAPGRGRVWRAGPFGTKRPGPPRPRPGWPRAGRRGARPGAAPVGPGRPRPAWPLRGTRRIAATITVLALCIATVAVVLSNRHHATPAAAATPRVATASPALRRSPLVHKTKPVKVRVPVRLVSEEPGVLHYRLAGGARVTLKAIGPCWVEIRRTDANGQEVYIATMAAGTTESVKAPAWVRLGRPTAVAVIVGGATVSPPVIAGRPYDLLFD
jgi:hypothetical protein